MLDRPRIRSARSAAVTALLTVAALLVAGGAMPDSPEPEEVEAVGWWRVTDGDLVLITNAAPRQARPALELLTALRQVVRPLLHERAVGVAVPTTVVLFADAASYEPFRLFERDGQYLPTPFESLVVVNAGSPRRPMPRIVAHEYLHALVAGAGLDLPLWLGEGLAEYYSTARVVGDRLVLGEPAADLASRLRRSPFLSFDELSALSSRSPEYLEDSNAERFYAQAWLLVHFVLSRQDGADVLGRVVEGIERGAGASDALEAALGLGPRELDEALRRHLDSGFPSRLRIGLSERPAGRTWSGRALAPSEWSREMAVLAVEQVRWQATPRRRAAAREWIARAATAAPDDGDLLAIEARLRALGGDRAGARALFERSVYLDARQGRSYAYYARFLLEASPPGTQAAEDAVAQARLLVERALELAPEHPWLRALRAEIASGVAPESHDARESPRP